MWTEPAELVLTANSARAIAESAVRGGFRVQVLDGFCDQDTRALGPCTLVPMAGWGLDPARLRGAIERLGASGGAPLGLVYGAGLESSPELLSALPGEMRLLGNGPAVLALLADPVRFFALLNRLEIPHPQTRFDPPPAADTALWLLKACGGSGGLGLSYWRYDGLRPAGPHYFQRRLDGDPMSVLFIANGTGFEVIGFNRLLVADGGTDQPFLYGGAIGQATLAEPVRQAVVGWVEALVGALGLCGLNSLDFILDHGHAYL
ncbi:MAG TPA: ATP-grasp domain-containing protein, partial [Lamprocystis sp. (in: g-proteobacteria)]|nr:ATP-grasp domain-containing protein [Lamprocystis sp. (in: g-proteobacteria)]